MKKIVLSVNCIFLIVLCVLSLGSCAYENDKNGDSSSESLVQITSESTQNDNVNKNFELNHNSICIYEDYAILSLCDVITKLGFELTWENTDVACFYVNDIKYDISISKKTLTKSGDDFNYLICAPGNQNFFCVSVDQDLLVDDNTVKCAFTTFIEYPIIISIDRNNNDYAIIKR